MKAIKYLGLTLLLAGCASPQPKDYYEIVGEVKNVEDSTIINLVKWDGDTGRTISVDTIIDGKFYFKIKPDSLAKDELSLGCHRSKKFPSMSAQLWASAGDYIKRWVLFAPTFIAIDFLLPLTIPVRWHRWASANPLWD